MFSGHFSATGRSKIVSISGPTAKDVSHIMTTSHYGSFKTETDYACSPFWGPKEHPSLLSPARLSQIDAESVLMEALAEAEEDKLHDGEKLIWMMSLWLNCM
jgi:hypothetical protein